MINFTKMHGIGNDFIIINNLENRILYSYSKLAEYLCNRNFGIGADGVIFTENSSSADFKMRIFNSDGSEAEMCGNGIRCFAKYLYENKLVQKSEILIETLAGIKNIKLIFEEKAISYIRVDMGEPCFDYEKIPVLCSDKREYLEIEGIELYPISMGNPHVVCFLEDIDNIDIKKYGKTIENYKYFPNKTNVEFVEILNKNTIKIRVWERGVGETLACGTGACAAAIISQRNKGLENKINVKLKGGNLTIEYNKSVFLEGEAEEIFKGEIKI